MEIFVNLCYSIVPNFNALLGTILVSDHNHQQRKISMPDSPAFTIRTLETHADYFRAEAAQRVIWDVLDNTQVVPLHVLITAQTNGGLAAGAFDPADHMIGFLFGFLGRTDDGHLKHCSHLMGVLPDVRRSGVGEALKRFQREYVLAQGIDLITWTFDPLEGVNASLNIGKLRTIARAYYPNLYDEMADNLNTGIPTDRFEVEWWLNSPRVVTPTPRPLYADLIATGAQLINPALMGDRVVSPGALQAIPTNSRYVLIEVPASYQAIKKESMQLAQAWRFHTRVAFMSAFAAGYVVMDFISEAPRSETITRRNFYVLEKSAPSDQP